MKPAMMRKFRTPKFRTSEIMGSSTFMDSQKQKMLLYPPWLAIANATRTLPNQMDENLRTGKTLPTFGEENQACLAIQRCWKGFIARAVMWRFGGVGSHHMASKIQKRYRGVRGRRKAAKRWQERDTEMADQMIALYWGMKGRKMARENRVANWYYSASMIQRNYRGRLGKKIFAIHKERVRNKKATLLQRCWRGCKGREYSTRYRGKIDEGEKKMKMISRLHSEGKLWASIFDKDGDGEEDDDAMPEESELVEAALCLMCNAGDMENARLYIRDALRYYPESPRALFTYAILLHLVWDCYGFLRVPRPDILDEGLEIVAKAWELDPERTCYADLEVAYFQSSRRSRPSDPRKLCNQAVMLHIVYGSFNSQGLSRQRLKTFWDSNRRAEGLFKRSIDLDYSCQHPQIRSSAKVFRSLYKSPRELCVSKVKGFPIGSGGGKVIFNIDVYKCVDKDGTDLDRREKFVCAARERVKAETARNITSDQGGKQSEAGSDPKRDAEGGKLSLLKRATSGHIAASAMKVEKLENAFDIKGTRRKATAQTTKSEGHADMQRYKAHLRMLNLKVNPVSREFVVHEQEWRGMLGAAIEMEKRAGRPGIIVERDAKKDPMKIVAGFIAARLCIRSTFDTIENERQR